MSNMAGARIDSRFMTGDLRSLFVGLYIVFLGDSNSRRMYYDAISLMQHSEFVSQEDIKTVGTESHLGDKLIGGGKRGKGLHNGKSFREIRAWNNDDTLIEYYYITRSYSEYVNAVIENLGKPDHPRPDVIICSSCVWDINRYGFQGVGKLDYPRNVAKLFSSLQEHFPSGRQSGHCQIIWQTGLPVKAEPKGGVFDGVPVSLRAKDLNDDMRLAGFSSAKVASAFGIEVVDMFHHFEQLLHLQDRDGIHWHSKAYRRMTNILAGSICKARCIPLPTSWTQHVRPTHKRKRSDDDTAGATPKRPKFS